MEKRELIIIGSGPAGLTAAIYAGRAGLKPLVIAGEKWGGQLMDTTLVENYPGFPDGIMGPELMGHMLKQAENHGAEILYKSATAVDVSEEKRSVSVGEEVYETEALILALGSSPRKLGVPGEEKFWGKGVSTCATCDGAFYKEKEIIVVGGGDTAMEESCFLSKFASNVTIVHRRDKYRATKAMQDRVDSKTNTKKVWNSEVIEILGEDTVTGVKIRNTETGEESELKTDGVFLAIGHVPNTQLLTDQVELTERGYVAVTDRTRTSVEGVYVAGDLHDHEYEQAVTAAGMGCMAAMDAQKWIDAKRHRT